MKLLKFIFLVLMLSSAFAHPGEITDASKEKMAKEINFLLNLLNPDDASKEKMAEMEALLLKHKNIEKVDITGPWTDFYHVAILSSSGHEYFFSHVCGDLTFNPPSEGFEATRLECFDNFYLVTFKKMFGSVFTSDPGIKVDILRHELGFSVENLFDIFNHETEVVSYIENLKYTSELKKLKGFKLNKISLYRYVVAKYVRRRTAG